VGHLAAVRSNQIKSKKLATPHYAAMRAIIQRVLSGKVVVGDKVVGEIKTDRGLVVLVGITRDDNKQDVAYMYGIV